MILKGIFTGDFSLIWNGFIKIALNAVSAVIKIFIYGFSAIYNVVAFIVNLIKDLFFNIISIAIEGILLIAKATDKVLGTNMSGFVQNALNNWKSIQAMISVPYASGDLVKTAQEKVDTIMNKIEVSVTLDGKEIANNVSTRINDSANATS